MNFFRNLTDSHVNPLFVHFENKLIGFLLISNLCAKTVSRETINFYVASLKNPDGSLIDIRQNICAVMGTD